MSDLQDQLALLRRRVAGIDLKYKTNPTLPLPFPPRLQVERCGVQDWLSGQEVVTEHGRHFETEKLYERHRRHGSADIGALADLPNNLLTSISDGSVAESDPGQWAFLDTETTGLAGGSGTCAFLVGIGRITPQGFYVRQFFMRDYAEEASLLDAVARHLAQFRVLITYNGRSYDQPLLETRYRLNRARPPFGHMDHLDLLHGARRLWKLRFDSCRLVDLETEVLGVERQGDLPGALIPYVYFEYLRHHDAARLLPIFHHNSLDIVTLACLTGIVPGVFQDPPAASLRHGSEVLGIARWLRQAGEIEKALDLFRRAVDTGLPDPLLFPTLWDIGALERKLGPPDRPLATWTDLAASPNPFRAKALEELAKHYEHREKNYAMALEMTRTAIGVEDTDALRRRELRLQGRQKQRPLRKSAKPRSTQRAASVSDRPPAI